MRVDKGVERYVIYSYYTRKDDYMEIVKGLYGSEFDKCRSCGYCHLHHKYLTVKQLKQHDCLSKQCWHLQKNEEHCWWKQRESTKQKRKARKEKINSYIN